MRIKQSIAALAITAATAALSISAAAGAMHHAIACHHGGHHAVSIHRSAARHQAAVKHKRTRHAGLLRVPSTHPAIRHACAGDYLSQMEGESRWPAGQIIRVWVAPGRASFPRIIANCFAEWSRASGGRIHYCLVHNRAEANYTITWHRNQKEVSDGTEAGLTTTDTYIDPASRKELIQRAHTSILTCYDGHMLSDKDIAETCLHEIGHGLGIEGHSANPCDIMYYAVSCRQTGCLTRRDCNTIARLYR